MKYKEQISKFKVSKKVDNEIMKKICDKRFNFKFKYAITILIICILSVTTIVNAENIKEMIRSLGKQKISDTQNEVILEEIGTIKTNLDEVKLDEKDVRSTTYENNLGIVTNISYQYINQETISFQELEKVIGIDLIGVDKAKYTYNLWNIKRKGIDNWETEQISFEAKIPISYQKIDNSSIKDKVIYIRGKIYTDNYKDKIENYEYQGWKGQILTKVGQIDTPAMLLSSYVIDSDGTETDELVNELHFNYKNVQYIITSYNIESVDLLEYLNKNLK